MPIIMPSSGVAETTSDGLPYASCDCTTTGKPIVALGDDPPLTEVTARAEAVFGETVNVSPAPFEWLPSLTTTVAVSAV